MYAIVDGMRRLHLQYGSVAAVAACRASEYLIYTLSNNISVTLVSKGGLTTKVL